MATAQKMSTGPQTQASYSYIAGVGVNNNDVVIQTLDVSQYREFILQSTAGAMDVFVSLDGTNYSTSALSLIDLGATINDPVSVTAAGRTYAFFGVFSKIQVHQNGATAVADAALTCG